MADESTTQLEAPPQKVDEESSASETGVGVRIRELRLARKLSLQDLATASGVSVGMLSQIERGMANPSLRTLTRIRMALNVTLSALFSDSPGEREPGIDFVRRASSRPRLDLGPGYVRKELLSSAIARNLQFMILNIPPGGGSGSSPMAYPAEKGGLVLEGEFRLSVAGYEAVLREGDSFQFDSALPHHFRNTGAVKARVLWIIGQTLPERQL